MSKNLHKPSKLHNVPKQWILVLTFAVIGIGIIGGVTFAKYYANNSNKGVTAAANYYFSSDVLDDAVNKEENPAAGKEEWKEVYNTDAWEGQSDYRFEVKIQNYQNQLLYNSDNLDIEYEITFKLVDTNKEGKNFTVSYGSEATQTLTNKGDKISFKETITGGTAKSNTFTVTFPAPSEVTDDYQSPGIEVVAKITGPDFLANTNTTIGAELHAGILKADYNLEGEFEFFESYQGDNAWNDNSTAAVNSMAAFPYSISYTPGKDNAAHNIQISWNATQLELNKFDEHYSQVTTSGEISTLTVTMQPKELLELVFYRADYFSLENMRPTDFWNLITIEDLDKQETSGTD